MFRHRSRFYSLFALAVLTLAAVGCGPQGTGQPPTAVILSPATGSSVPLNVPLTVQASGSDSSGLGVIRLDLLVNGTAVDTFQSPTPQATVMAGLNWTPTATGSVTLAVVAYNANGVPSLPATIALSVGGGSQGGGTSGGSDGDVGVTVMPPDSGNSNPPGGPSSSGNSVQAQANIDVPVREKPGPGCPQIGVVPRGTTINLLQVTDSPNEYWYQTDFLGVTLLGWVYHEPFSLLSDDSSLPRVHEVGCLYCGDSVCSPAIDEACNTCEADCGPCCGNGVCEAQFGEACDVCVADCGVCPFCGDGSVNQDWEECDGGGCGDGFYCEECLCYEEEDVDPCAGLDPDSFEYCDCTGGSWIHGIAGDFCLHAP